MFTLIVLNYMKFRNSKSMITNLEKNCLYIIFQTATKINKQLLIVKTKLKKKVKFELETYQQLYATLTATEIYFSQILHTFFDLPTHDSKT